MMLQMCSSNLYTSTMSSKSGFSPNPATLHLKNSIWRVMHDRDIHVDTSNDRHGDRHSDNGLSIVSTAASA